MMRIENSGHAGAVAVSDETADCLVIGGGLLGKRRDPPPALSPALRGRDASALGPVGLPGTRPRGRRAWRHRSGGDPRRVDPRYRQGAVCAARIRRSG